jgi:hypothetical protein
VKGNGNPKEIVIHVLGGLINGLAYRWYHDQERKDGLGNRQICGKDSSWSWTKGKCRTI